MTITDLFRKVTAFIGAFTKPIFNFLKKHWVSVGVVLLGLIVFGLITALLIFTWPAFIGTVAGITITLPIIGTVAPMLFLSTLSVPAAAAVLGFFAFAGFIIGSALLAGSMYVFNYLYTKLDNWFTSDLPNEERAQALNEAMTDMTNAMNKLYRAGYLAGSNNFHKKQVIDFMNDYKADNIQFNSPLGRDVFSPNSRNRNTNPLNPLGNRSDIELDEMNGGVARFFDEPTNTLGQSI